MFEGSLTELAVAGGSALMIGTVVGILIGRRRGAPDAADWKMRLAARDTDLAAALDRLADTEIALQAARDRAPREPLPNPELEARIAELTEELGQADEELARLQSLGVDQAPAGSSAMARRLEALEVELSTLASMRCPDPSAHRATSRRPAPDPRGAQPGPGDDLTLIDGVGPGLAEVLRRMGYHTYDDVASLDDDALDTIDRMAGGVAGPSAREGWVRSARQLAERRSA